MARPGARGAWDMKGRYVPHRVLKVWGEAAAERRWRRLVAWQVAKGRRTAQVRSAGLLRPAFSPFLVLRFGGRNSKKEVHSIQFVSRQDGGYCYANVEGDPRWPQGAWLEWLVVVEPPLSEGTWAVRVVDAGGKASEFGELWLDQRGVWRFRGEGDIDDVDDDGQPWERMRGLFVGGPPKSGTTWVEQILNSHPQSLVTGENMFFGWPAKEAILEWMDMNPPPYFARAVPQRGPFRSQVAMLYAGRARAVLGQIGAVAGVRLVGDKWPRYGSVAVDALESLGDWRYVHCLRHPLDVMVSRFFHERNLLRDAPELSDVPEGLRNAVRDGPACRAQEGGLFPDEALLRAFVELALQGHEGLALAGEERVHVVRYEDLLAHFEETVAALFRFCGLEAGEAEVGRARENTRFERLAGRRRGSEDKGSFYRKGVAGDYHTYMTRAQIEAAWRLVTERAPRYAELYEV